jgi:hypothetical protein
MTAEQAKAIAEEVWGVKPIGSGSSAIIDRIAAALVEAVEGERAACLAEATREATYYQTAGLQLAAVACGEVAAKIEARGTT